MENLLINFALAHREWGYGIVTGYALGHIPQAVAFVFHQAMRLPWLRAAVVANPAKAKDLVRAIEQELEKDIDAEAAPQAPPPEAHQ